MWIFGLIALWITFSLGVITGMLRTQRRYALAIKKGYELGVEDGKKQVTEGGYRQPAAHPPEPPRNSLEAAMERGMQMLAAAGMWMDEHNRADREHKR